MHAEAQFIDMAAVKQLNADNGMFFFTPGAMRFFRARTSNSAMVLASEAYFVTSEQFDADSPRLYTARCCAMHGSDAGRVRLVGDYTFQQFRTSKEAWQAIDAYIANNATEWSRSR